MIHVLDHGYVKHIESWGHGEIGLAEAGIIEAARQSTQGCFRGWDRDEKLLRFLYEHKHSSPFEFAGMVIEVQAPIMVFREWHRHRTQSYNEMSGRYTELPNLYYVPSVERLMAGAQNQHNKQGSIVGFNAEEAVYRRKIFAETMHNSRIMYEQLLHLGVSRELARGVLPVFQYSRMRACANLRNWLAFLTLRLHPDAQEEIRLFASAVADVIKIEFPRTYGLFSESL